MNIKKILGISKSILYNITLFGIEGFKLPILFSNNVKIKGLRRNCIKVNHNKGRVFCGLNGVDGIQPSKKNNLNYWKNGRD